MPRLAWFALAPCFLLSGCFSMMSQADFGMGNSKGPTPGAVALDAVTLPVQAPVLLAAGANRIHDESKIRRETDAILAELEKDPELLFDAKMIGRCSHGMTRIEVAKWANLKAELPEGFQEDLLYELLRHKGHPFVSFSKIPDHLSPDLLERLYADRAAHCLSSGVCEYHMEKLLRAFVLKNGDSMEQFILKHPAKARELLAAYHDVGEPAPTNQPSWWRGLRESDRKVSSGEYQAMLAGREAVARLDKDPSLILRPEFWAGLPRPESRALVRSWLTRALDSKEKSVFTDEQLFELCKADGPLPDEVRLFFLPERINPRDNPELFERIFAHSLAWEPGIADRRSRAESLLLEWCYRAIDEKRPWNKPWSRENAKRLVARYPEHCRKLVNRYKGQKYAPSFHHEILGALIMARRAGP
ncbi:MAG: hypothetical protein RL639_1158 [Verrucomicrobiota bacterium]|jgi:hypothetical protein